jgi:cytochrome b561
VKATRRYGAVAKIIHWTVLGFLIVQYAIGWLMPDIHGGMEPGRAMIVHISLGLTILVLTVMRLAWRILYPVMPESSLPAWQRYASGTVHWLLYALVIATTVTGWLFASFRGWTVSFFFALPLPMVASKNAAGVRFIDGWHQAMEWSLLVVIGVHVAAALIHVFLYRDRVMHRMLPE